MARRVAAIRAAKPKMVKVRAPKAIHVQALPRPKAPRATLKMGTTKTPKLGAPKQKALRQPRKVRAPKWWNSKLG